MRLSTTTGVETQHFSWDRNGPVPLLLTDGSTRYIYGPGGIPIEQVTAGGATTYYHHDQLGSTRMLTDSSGKVTGTFSYTPYGAPAGSTGEQTTPLGYAGQYTDPVSGLQYLRARYYDPATGQFISRDPLNAVTRSPYGYVANNPLNGSDPTGMFFGEGILGGITDSFNPLKYYEEEIDSIENGCSYLESVNHGLQGAAIAFLDVYGAGEVIGLARGGAGGSAAAAGEVTGYTQHGYDRAMGREGVGVSDAAIQDAVRDPEKVIYQQGTVKYVGANAIVVLNPAGQVVTAWATNRSGYRR